MNSPPAAEIDDKAPNQYRTMTGAVLCFSVAGGSKPRVGYVLLCNLSSLFPKKKNQHEQDFFSFFKKEKSTPNKKDLNIFRHILRTYLRFFFFDVNDSIFLYLLLYIQEI